MRAGEDEELQARPAHGGAHEHTPEARCLALRVERHPLPPEPLCASAVVMVRPASFAANPETADSNAFQAPHAEAELAAIRARALAEHEAFAAALRGAGVRVLMLADLSERACPDAVFPNNWVTLHADGTAILYPMQAPSRRREVRLDLFELLERERLFTLRRLLDLRPLAGQGEFLEGTGSLVLDRPRRLAYACRSPRTSERALHAFAAATGYAVHAFHAADAGGVAIYHTNVLLALAPSVAVCCLESVRDPAERAALRASLAQERELVELSPAQVERFAGNLLALAPAGREPVLALSARALSALTPAQRTTLERHAQLVSAALPTLEHHGGGSARCMLLEVS